MAGESARSLRKAAIAVAALGALSLAVPASLWLSPSAVFPVLQPVGHTVQARALDSAGGPLDSPARLRPGSSAEIMVTGFDPYEPVLLRRSAAAPASPGGRADEHGVFHYRLRVPASMPGGAHSLTVIGTSKDSQLTSAERSAVFRYVVGADQAG